MKNDLRERAERLATAWGQGLLTPEETINGIIDSQLALLDEVMGKVTEIYAEDANDCKAQTYSALQAIRDSVSGGKSDE